MTDLIRDIEPWFADGLFVSPSAIHGRGLHTTQPLNRGIAVLRFGGWLYNVAERRSAAVLPSTTTPVSEGVILAEPSEGEKDLSDYLNHSCAPNVGFRDALSVVAIADIPKDGELVIDYAFWECDAKWQLKTPCNCGSRDCRSTVTGDDWKRIPPTDPTFPYFSPFLKRRILAFRNNQEKDHAEE